MDWVSCKIALGGDAGNVMVREENPVSWPEVKILQSLHGEANVYDAEFVRSEPSNVQTEKLRLLSIYGKEALDNCYPGARPYMEMDYPGEKDPISIKRPERRPIPSKDDEPPLLDMTAKGAA